MATPLVSDRTHCEQQTREHDRVGINEPLKLGLRRADAPHNRGKANVHNRVIDRSDRYRNADCDKSEPTPLMNSPRRPMTRHVFATRFVWLGDP